MPDTAAPDAPAAAANNAAWCDLVCRAARLPTTSGAGLWSTPRRSPDAYPDAVTLARGVPVAEVLAAIDDSAGASVKDSFADLDLAPHGYAVLFEAQWLSRAPGPTSAPDLPWRTVDASTLPQWLAAHGSAAITRAVLDDPGVRLLLAADGDGPLAVAALNRSRAGADPVVGVSNVQALRADPELVWRDLARVARRELGPHPLVGYESGADLVAPRAVGFEPVGGLRVWLR
ncbi:hypothetical protein [Cellulomonas sp. ICMP 17802]|uniref:hypothetical protein n=1 Tax=Cellulomonas sp. ICMP 17802 TaxID=3239199 RepID=UPI00351B9BA3